MVTKYFGLLLLSSIFILTFLYILPLRDQTFGDDWAYRRSVEQLLNTGQLKVSDWSSASLIFQIFWGALFSKLFGFSQKILDLSTITMLFLGLISFYQLLKRLSVSELRAGLFTTVLLVFPWVFQFSFSFNTNIVAMSLVIISVYFYIRGWQEHDYFNFLIGGIVASFAILTRQDSVVIIMAFLITCLVSKFSKKELLVKKLLSGLLIPVLVILFYYMWLFVPGHLTIAQYKTTFISAKVEYLGHFLPWPLERIKTTNLYYAKYLQRLITYTFHLIGFLLPIFLVFNIRLVSILAFGLTNLKGISLAAAAFLFIFGVEYLFRYGSVGYEIDPPSLIFVYSNLLPTYQDWLKAWNYIIFGSVVIWIPILGVSIKNAIKTFFIKSSNRLSLNKNNLLIYGLFVAIWVMIYIQNYIDHFKSNNLLTEYLHDSWLVLIFIIFTPILAKYLFATYSLKKPDFKLLPQLFLTLTFTLEVCFLLFLMIYQWPQYVLSLIPFVIIWLSQVTKSWQINYFRVGLVIICMVWFSVSVTKERYQTNGIIFELANDLVKKQVEPMDINVKQTGLAWLPWWYYDQTLQEAIVAANGNKYAIDGLGTWNVIQDYVPSYIIEPVRLNHQLDWSDTQVRIIASRDFYFDIFSRVKFVVYKRKLEDFELELNSSLKPERFFLFQRLPIDR